MVIALPVFYLVTFFFAVLAVWIQGALSRRSGNRCFRIARNKQIIRTRPPQGRTGSDYIGLVRMTGLEPVRPFEHKHLKLASLPIPAHPRIRPFSGRQRDLLYAQTSRLSTGFSAGWASLFPDQTVAVSRGRAMPLALASISLMRFSWLMLVALGS